MDSFTRYAARPSAQPSLARRLWDGTLVALAFAALFALAHLDLILWGAYP